MRCADSAFLPACRSWIRTIHGVLQPLLESREFSNLAVLREPLPVTME